MENNDTVEFDQVIERECGIDVHKEIFRLSREEGLTHEQISKKIHISVNTVKNHMSNTIFFLKIAPR